MINKFCILNGAKYFSSRILQNYLEFIPAKKYIIYFSATTWIDCGKLVECQEKILKITKSNSNFAPTFVDHVLPDINFDGNCLINNIIPIFKKVINLDITPILNPWLRNLKTDLTLKNRLFGFEKLTKNADQDKSNYSGYGIGFDSHSEFSFTDESMGKFVFGADMSSSVHIDNKNKDLWILGEGPTQGLDDSTLTTQVDNSINFTQPNKRFVLSLHDNGSNSFVFVNAIKICWFKAKDSEIRDYKLFLGNISKDFTINYMKKAWLKGSVIFFGWFQSCWH